MLPFYTLGQSVSVPAFGGGIHVRIGENTRKCVVFFGVPGAGPVGESIDFGGTGFIVGYKEPDRPDLIFGYLVTCRHVAQSLKKHEGTGFYVRLNYKTGGSLAFPLGKIDWRYPEDKTVDLAVVGFTFPHKMYDHIYFLLQGAADRNVQDQIVVGDVISVVGLFHPHAGTKKNVPIVHSGNIALLADPTEPVPVKDRETDEVIKSEVHLIEAQTLDGCSGAPVFMHEMGHLDFVNFADQDQTNPLCFGPVRLLGVYSGSWDGEPGKLLARDRSIPTTRKVPVGMGTVIPIDLLINFIAGDEFMKKSRRMAIDERDAGNAASKDDAFPAPRTNDENPNHREDFTSLLGAAARKQQQDD